VEQHDRNTVRACCTRFRAVASLIDSVLAIEPYDVS
jgi:hypothetical protein